MVSLRDALSSTLRESYCRLTRPADDFAELASPLLNTLPQSPAQDSVGLGIQGLRGVRSVFCSEPPDDARTGVPVPFTGGQCPGSLYDASWQVRFPPGNPLPVQNATNVVGPISLVTTNSATQNQVRLVDGNGDDIFSAASTIPADPPEVLSVSVSPLAGQPDDCGDPPRDIPEYDPNTFTDMPNVNYDDDNTGNPVNISPTLVYAPLTLDMENNVRVPFTLEFAPGVEVDGFVDLSTGDTTFNVDDTFGPAFEQPLTELPAGTPLEPGQGFVVGVRVVSTFNISDISANALSNGGGGPTIYVPRLGSVFFLHTTSESGFVQSRDFDIKLPDQVIYADRVATGAVASPIPGVTTTLSLIIVPPPLTETPW